MQVNDVLADVMLRPSNMDELYQELLEVPGMQLLDSHHARWETGGGSAELCLDAMGDLRIRLPSAAAAMPLKALEISSTLPGNCRYAMQGSAGVLIADIPIEFRIHLREAFHDLEQGIAMAHRVEREGIHAVEPPVIPKAEVQAVLRQPPWDEQSVVELPHGWELRPRYSGQSTAVTMTVEGRHVRLRRVVLPKLADQPLPAVAYAQALRFNAQLKHARLACSGEELLAEVCIHELFIDGKALATAARAVALAEDRVRTPLVILRADGKVASVYSEMFGSSDAIGRSVSGTWPE